MYALLSLRRWSHSSSCRRSPNTTSTDRGRRCVHSSRSSCPGPSTHTCTTRTGEPSIHFDLPAAPRYTTILRHSLLIATCSRTLQLFSVLPALRHILILPLNEDVKVKFFYCFPQKLQGKATQRTFMQSSSITLT